jgi:hypothetical protein
MRGRQNVEDRARTARFPSEAHVAGDDTNAPIFADLRKAAPARSRRRRQSARQRQSAEHKKLAILSFYAQIAATRVERYVLDLSVNALAFGEPELRRGFLGHAG